MKFETKLNKLGIDENEVKSIIMNCECGEINGAYLIDLTKEKKQFIMEVVGNYFDEPYSNYDFGDWTDIKRIATFCKVFGITEDEIPHYYALGFNEGGCDIAYTLESNKDVILVLTDDERYYNSFIQYSPSQQEETEEESTYIIEMQDCEDIHDELLTSSEARSVLEEQAGLTFEIHRSTRHYNAGEIIGYKFTDKEGNTFHKKADGTALIDTLCEYGNCKLIRVSKKGIRESNLVGWLVIDAKKYGGIIMSKIDLQEMLVDPKQSTEGEKMEEQTVEFKIVSNRNEQVYIEGYVNIPAGDCEDEDIEWYYYDSQGFANTQMVIHHDGVDGMLQRADLDKKLDVERFRNDYSEDSLWIETVICQSNEDENCTYVRENCTVIINKGSEING